ncbi:SHD1 domain-containing protein, partial [Pontiellaceae bacterium B12227]|nr:SHD1 domain-containing protein [Pontiellaceae bacterium B12227]
MKKGRQKRAATILKGAPSGLLISLLVHIAAFMLAGLLVVFTVVKKEEKKFVPPKPVDRPKMKLKKPKVKVKKTAKPKSTTRIVTKVKRASMPDIQLPEMSGMGEALGGGVGGFDIMPDLDEVTIFGSGQSIGSDFVGTFYDFKRDRSARPVPMTDIQFVDEVIKFTKGGWKQSKIARFYRSPKQLYATSIMVPPVRSAVAPAAFGEADTVGYAWMVHYKGQLVYPEDIKFRFWGHGDDVMVVRVNGKVVLNASWPDDNRGTYLIGGNWQSSAADSRRYYLGNNLAVVGDWITLKAGEPQDMEVIIGEVPGGAFCSMLVVQVDGVEYEKNRQGAPVLPIFKTSEPTPALIDAISAHLVPGEAAITEGPVFRDFSYSAGGQLEPTVVDEAPETEPSDENKMRVWSSMGGKTIEAEYLSTVAGQVVLRNANGKQWKVPLKQFSVEDREFIELENPPKLNITFVKKSAQLLIETTPYLNEQPP